MTTAYLDLETFSPVDLKRHGTHRYAEQAEVMLQVDGGEGLQVKVGCGHSKILWLWHRPAATTEGHPFPRILPLCSRQRRRSHARLEVIQNGDQARTIYGLVTSWVGRG